VQQRVLIPPRLAPRHLQHPRHERLSRCRRTRTAVDQALRQQGHGRAGPQQRKEGRRMHRDSWQIPVGSKGRHAGVRSGAAARAEPHTFLPPAVVRRCDDAARPGGRTPDAPRCRSRPHRGRSRASRHRDLRICEPWRRHGLRSWSACRRPTWRRSRA
jgi:hypothetical protein